MRTKKKKVKSLFQLAKIEKRMGNLLVLQTAI